MMRAWVLTTLIVLCCLTILPPLIAAAPMPPVEVVNHTTKECATIMGGDECMDCFPPEGWQILDTRAGEQCPDHYTRITNLGEECIPLKDRFCCSEGHSGVHGDCEDLVFHKGRKECAFVDDIHTTAPPQGWVQKPEALTYHQWFCPSGYEWIARLEVAPTAEPEPTPGPGLDPTAEAIEKESGPERKSLPCPSAALVGMAALCVSFARKPGT